MLEFSLLEVGKASMILFAVIDIIGSIPLIISIKQNAGDISSGKASLVALVILLGFLFLGESILSAIGVNVNAFAVAGSFIIFFLALEMVLGIKVFKDEQVSPKTVSVVPIAFPIIAGAGTMTSIISIRAEYAAVNIAIAIVLNIAFVFLVLKMTRRIEKLLGAGGIVILKKVFGIILLAIAVKLFSTNAKELFN